MRFVLTIKLSANLVQCENLPFCTRFSHDFQFLEIVKNTINEESNLNNPLEVIPEKKANTQKTINTIDSPEKNPGLIAEAAAPIQGKVALIAPQSTPLGGIPTAVSFQQKVNVGKTDESNSFKKDSIKKTKVTTATDLFQSKRN